MRIQHNIMAMNSYRNYTNNTSALAKNLEKLSSGYKINRAGDDAAGLAISEKMRAQITGLKTAQKNAKDGISLVQTAEGALTEVHDMLNRMVELADQSANGTYDNETDRANLQKEFDALRTEIDRIADSSNFNGIKLLDGSLSTKGVSKPGVEAGDYLMIDAGSNKVTVKKDQQISSATAGTQAFTAAVTNGWLGGVGGVVASKNGFTFDFRYVDEAGVEQTKSLTVNGIASTGSPTKTANAIAKAINDADLGFTVSQTGQKLKFTSTTKGSSGAKALGITITKTGLDKEGKGGTEVANKVEKTVADSQNVLGKDRDVSNKLTFATDFKIGDTITLGGKTYQFVEEGAVNKVKEGYTAVVAGMTSAGVIDQEKSMKNLVNALIADGVDARIDSGDDNTLMIDDLSQISINRKSIDVKVSSDAITSGNANATKGVWQINAGAGTSSATTLTIKYLDADGKEQSRTIGYTGDGGATTNATKIVSAIKNDEVLKNLFEVVQLATASGTLTAGIQISSLNAGANGAQIKSVKSNDAAATALSDDLRQISEGKDAAAGFVIGADVKAGDTVAVAGKTFEFVKEGDVGKVAEGNIAVVIGSDGKKTAANFNEALKDAGFTTSYVKDTNAVRVVENEFSLGSTNAQKGSGGLTLQIGDTAEDFNQLTVSVNDMHAKALGLADISIDEQDNAKAAVDVIKKAINSVSSTRGDLGATQNRLEHTISNLSVMQENIQDAESSIRDVDVADEMMEYTKNNILVQSAQAMLAQANQVPQGVLQLLQ